MQGLSLPCRWPVRTSVKSSIEKLRKGKVLYILGWAEVEGKKSEVFPTRFREKMLVYECGI